MAQDPQQFASDNYAGVCPEAWSAMAEANIGHAAAYGEDAWTARAADAFRNLFETELRRIFRFQRHRRQCAGAVRAVPIISQRDLLVRRPCRDRRMRRAGVFLERSETARRGSSEDGKLTPQSVRALATGRSDIHFPKPSAVTITQATETGQVYGMRNQALSAVCRELGLRLHMDGARFANACATLGARRRSSPGRPASTCSALAGQKTAWPWARPSCFSIGDLPRISTTAANRRGNWPRKCDFWPRHGSACWKAAPGSRNAAHANACARRLEAGIKGVPGVAPMFPVEANSVFLEPGRGSRGAEATWLALLHFHRRRRAFHVRLGRRSRPRRCAAADIREVGLASSTCK